MDYPVEIWSSAALLDASHERNENRMSDSLTALLRLRKPETDT